MLVNCYRHNKYLNPGTYEGLMFVCWLVKCWILKQVDQSEVR